MLSEVVKTIDFLEDYKKEAVLLKGEHKVETLVCDGDGLGIQSKITY